MEMIVERFTDSERHRLLDLAMAAVPNNAGDAQLTAIISRLLGTDTVLVAHRAYSSSAERATVAR